MEKLRDNLAALVPLLESSRGRAIWLGAPVALTDAVQSALDALNEAAIIADKEIERKLKGAFEMKELNAMLEKYKAAKESIQGVSERLDKIQETCAKYNAGLDAFFADADAIDAVCEAEGTPVDEAAPNGEVAEGVVIAEGAV